MNQIFLEQDCEWLHRFNKGEMRRLFGSYRLTALTFITEFLSKAIYKQSICLYNLNPLVCVIQCQPCFQPKRINCFACQSVEFMKAMLTCRDKVHQKNTSNDVNHKMKYEVWTLSLNTSLGKIVNQYVRINYENRNGTFNQFTQTSLSSMEINLSQAGIVLNFES